MCGFTQNDGCVRGVAPTQNPPSTLSSLLGFDVPNILPEHTCSYNSVPGTDTGTGVSSRANGNIGGVLARALPEGLRYLST
jgi:hypothetical protein